MWMECHPELGDQKEGFRERRSLEGRTRVSKRLKDGRKTV